MDSLIRSMKWDEEKFGREYDLDLFNIVAVSDFNMGRDGEQGPEHLQRSLHSRDAGNGHRSGLPQTSKAIVAHEYSTTGQATASHCRDWFQLCLKEG